MNRQPRLSSILPMLLAGVALIGLSACATTSPGNMAAPITDGQALHIAMTLDMGEVITSEPAVGKATNPQVRQFAQDMVTMHTQAAQQTRDLADREDVTLLPNQVSIASENEARGVAQKLSALSGSEFDMMYMEAQHTLHQHGLNMLDFNLIPAARDAEVRAHLTEKRAVVQQHLERTRQILQSMM